MSVNPEPAVDADGYPADMTDDERDELAYLASSDPLYRATLADQHPEWGVWS